MGVFVRTLRSSACAAWFSLLLPCFAISTGTAAEIAVTLPPLAGLVGMLDKQADVLCLLPNGSDPHHFQLTPRSIESMQQTKLLIRASKDDGGWPLPPYHASQLDVWPDTDHGWLNPATVRDVLPLLAKALSDLHPHRQAAIEHALQDALNNTHAIAAAWQMALEPVKKAGVLMQHPAWRGLMQAMHVPVLDVLESGRHGHEHGPRQLEHALTTLNAHPGAWLIADSGHNNSAVDWLYHHTDPQPRRVSFNVLGDCAQSWPALMQYNLDQAIAENGIVERGAVDHSTVTHTTNEQAE